jgi:PAS domain S-box-containing protein
MFTASTSVDVTSDPGNSVDGTREVVDTVVLAMPAKRNRELLSELLGSLPSYRVETATEPAQIPDEYDLCLVDLRLRETLRPVLTKRREQSGSVFLPHLLVVPGTSGSDPEDIESELDPLFDDVVQFPMRKALLRRRLDNALRTRRATTTLAAREQQYRNLVELTPETILLLDGETVVYANTVANALFDTESAADIEGRSVTDFVGDEERSRLRSVLDSIEEQGGSDSEFVELPMESTTGRELYVAVAGVKVTDDSRRLTQLIVRDLTTEKQRTNGSRSSGGRWRRRHRESQSPTQNSRTVRSSTRTAGSSGLPATRSTRRWVGTAGFSRATTRHRRRSRRYGRRSKQSGRCRRTS